MEIDKEVRGRDLGASCETQYMFYKTGVYVFKKVGGRLTLMNTTQLV